MKRIILAATLALCTLMSACDMLGIESASAQAARRDAEGKAVGAACRHAGRAIEDCYALNRKADKAAMFAGWREMNDYMRENKIDSVAPALSSPGVANKGSTREVEVEEAAPKPAKPRKDS